MLLGIRRRLALSMFDLALLTSPPSLEQRRSLYIELGEKSIILLN